MGGTVSFLQLPNGAWIIRDWVIRLPLVGVDANLSDPVMRRARVTVRGYLDTGGEGVAVSFSPPDTVLMLVAASCQIPILEFMPNQVEHLGEALADRYRILREIGAGAKSTAYLAQDLTHEGNVALKVLRPSWPRYLAELRLAPNVTLSYCI